MITENEVRGKIKELEELLKDYERMYYSLDPINFESPYGMIREDYWGRESMRRKILMGAFNIESRLAAYHDVLGEKYFYKHM